MLVVVRILEPKRKFFKAAIYLLILTFAGFSDKYGIVFSGKFSYIEIGRALYRGQEDYWKGEGRLMNDSTAVATAADTATTSPAPPLPEGGDKQNGDRQKVAPATLQDFVELFGAKKRTARFTGGSLNIHHINVLTQTRSEFPDTEDFAQGIAANGLLHPLVVAEFTMAKAAEYVDWVNYLWGTDHSPDDLKSVRQDGKPRILILISGERRLRAHKHLYEHGCGECQDADGEDAVRNGVCFERHFGVREQVEVRICTEISPPQAFVLQNVENTHVSVAAWREASAYLGLWRSLEQKGLEISITRFARLFGRNSTTVKNALAFSQLPQMIREAVANKQVKYGHALAIAELQECMEQYVIPEVGRKGVDEAEILGWLTRVTVKPVGVEEFRQRIRSRIEAIKSGQSTLWGIWTSKERARERKNANRDTAGAEYVRFLWIFYNWIIAISKLAKEGKLATRGVPKAGTHSEQSPVRVFRLISPALAETLPYVRYYMPKSAFPKIMASLEVLDQKVPQLSDDPSEDEVVQLLKRSLDLMLMLLPHLMPFIPGDDRSLFENTLRVARRQLPGGKRKEEVAAGQTELMVV
jgi:hypothetical protein